MLLDPGDKEVRWAKMASKTGACVGSGWHWQAFRSAYKIPDLRADPLLVFGRRSLSGIS